MRCVKCGYISFDHHSECNKCKTDLTVARDGFGFVAGKPAVPFLLGSLIRDYVPPTQEDSIVAEPAETGTSASFDFAVFEGVSDGFLQEDPEIGAAEPVAAPVSPDDSEEDFSLLDLSDEELELLIDKESLGSSEIEALLPGSVTGGADNHPSELLSVGEPAPPALEIPQIEADTASTPASEPEELMLNLDDFPLELESDSHTTPTLELVPKSKGDPIEIESESKAIPAFGWATGDSDPIEIESEDQTAPAFELTPKFHDEPTVLEHAPEPLSEVKPGDQKARPQSGDLANDFVIELSENDLDALIEELSSTPKGSLKVRKQEAGSKEQEEKSK